MKKEALRVTSAIPVAPTTLYFAWLSSEQHSAMTGGAAKIDPTVGATFTAWNGKISGKLVILDLGRRIVMSWRTSDFPSDAHDSRVEVHFEGLGAGTRLTVLHTDIPEGLGESIREAWQSKYFVPMRAYFSKYLPDPRNPPVRRLPPPPPEDEEEEDEAPARTKGKPAKGGLANAAASLVKKTVAAVKAKVLPTAAKAAKPTLAKPTPPKMAQPSPPSAKKTAKPAPAKPAKKAPAKPAAPTKKATAKPAKKPIAPKKKATAKPAKKPVAPKKKATAKPAKPAKKKAAAKPAKTKTKTKTKKR